MAITDAITGFVWNLLFWGGTTLGFIILMSSVTYPIWIKRLYPIRFIVLKNSGGARDNDTVMFDHDIIKRGRVKKTAYGPRIKIRGVPNTLPMNVVSREHAITIDGGGSAFMIYEKELNQFFPIESRPKNIDLMLGAHKKENEKVAAIYEDLKQEHPNLAHHFRLGTPKTLTAPVSFTNHTVKLRPFPIDIITPFIHDMEIRREQIHKKTWMEKYGFYTVAILIVAMILAVTVLSYEQTNKSIDERLAAFDQQQDGFAQKIADKLAPGETAPGAPLGFLLPPAFFARRRRRT